MRRPPPDPTRVAIVGVGLMGGSLGLALRRRPRGKRWRVHGVGRRPATLRLAKRLGCVAGYSKDWKAGVERASVVILAVPVDKIVSTAKRLRPHLSPGALVMDVGSVKEPIVRRLEPLFREPRGPRFVGVHPMAGSENFGAAHARAGLYEGAACVITPGRRTAAADVRRAERFWRSVGARTLRMTPAAHDAWMAIISHLPHLLADTLVLSTARWQNSPATIRRLVGGSYRDMTRVARADPRLWDQIFRMNRANIRRAARLFGRVLSGLARRPRAVRELRRARRLRDQYVPLRQE